MKPLDILFELEVAECVRTHPLTGEKNVRSCTKRRKQSRANDITKAIIKFLRLSGHQAKRINTMGRTIDNRRTVYDCLGHARQIGSTKYIPTTGTKGSADISATINGRSVKIEVKAGRDRMSAAQRQYQADIEKAGGVYVIAHSFDGFYEWYREYIQVIKDKP